MQQASSVRGEAFSHRSQISCWVLEITQYLCGSCWTSSCLQTSQPSFLHRTSAINISLSLHAFIFGQHSERSGTGNTAIRSNCLKNNLVCSWVATGLWWGWWNNGFLLHSLSLVKSLGVESGSIMPWSLSLLTPTVDVEVWRLVLNCFACNQLGCGQSWWM